MLMYGRNQHNIVKQFSFNKKIKTEKKKKKLAWDFPISPAVKKAPCNAGDTVSIPDQGTRILHTLEQLSPHIITRLSV